MAFPNPFKAAASTEDAREAFAQLQPIVLGILETQPNTYQENLELESKLRILYNKMQLVTPMGLQATLDYVIIPLTTLLRYFVIPFLQPDSDNNPITKVAGADRVREALLDCVAKMVCTVPSIHNNVFSRVIQVVLKVFDLENVKMNGNITPQSVISAETNQGALTLLSEEAKRSTVDIIRGIFDHYKPDIIIKENASVMGDIEMRYILHDKEMQPSLGFLIYRLLEYAVRDRSKEIKANALETLCVVCERIDSVDTIAAFLPGILSSLSKVITGDYKQGHRTFEAALKLLSFVVCATLRDDANPNIERVFHNISASEAMDALKRLHTNQKNTSTTSNKPQVQSDATTRDPKTPFVDVKRDQQWYEKAISHVQPMLSRVFALSSRGGTDDLLQSSSPANASFTPASIIYHNWQVRLALVKCASEIAVNCFHTLSQLVATLLEVIVLHVYDDVEEVCKFSQKALSNFSSAFNDGDGPRGARADVSDNPKLQRLLEENFSKLISSLPRIIRDPDDTTKLLRSRLAVGYIRLLKTALPTILTTNLSRLGVAMLQILEFDLEDSRLTQRQSTGAFLLDAPASARSDSSHQTSFGTHYLRKTFKHFKDDRVLYSIVLLCRLLGYYGEPLTVVDFFVNVLRSGESGSMQQAVFILNELCLGASGILDYEETQPKDAKRAKPVVEYLLAEYTSPELWNFFGKQDGNTAQLIRTDLLAEHVVLSSLYLEGIGNFAQIMQSEFKMRLMDVLYPILEKLGEDSDVISVTAWSTLLRIAFYCGYSSVLDLIKQNTDYLVDSICQNMRYFKRYESCLRVLHGVLKHAGELMIPLLGDIMDEVFRGLDDRQAEFTTSFLRILHSIVSVIANRTVAAAKAAYEDAEKKKTHKITYEDDDVESMYSLVLAMQKRRTEGKTFYVKDFLAKKIEVHAKRKEEFRKDRESSERPEVYFKKYHAEKDAKQETGAGRFEDDPQEPDDSSNASAFSKTKDEEEEEARREAEDPVGNRLRKEFMKEFGFVERILTKCQHFTAIKSIDARMVVLDIIAKGVEAITPDKDRLLPLVHTLWDPLRYRFIDTDYRVQQKALEVMKVLGKSAKDFVSKRFSDDLWPHIRTLMHKFNIFVRSNRNELIRAGDATQYTDSESLSGIFRYMPTYTKQRGILECLLICAKCCKLNEKDIKDLVLSCWFYLSSDQPSEILDLARQLYVELAKFDSLFVWLVLSELSQAKYFPPEDMSSTGSHTSLPMLDLTSTNGSTWVQIHHARAMMASAEVEYKGVIPSSKLEELTHDQIPWSAIAKVMPQAQAVLREISGM